MVHVGDIPMGVRYPDVLRNLKIYDPPTWKTGDGVNIIGTRHKNTPVHDVGSHHKNIAMRVVDLALALLATETGTDTLQDLLQCVVAHWNHYGIDHYFPANMDYRVYITRRNLVSYFLQQLRASHPGIWIAENDGMEGKDAKVRCKKCLPDGQTIIDFDPSRSCEILVNRLVGITSNGEDTPYNARCTNSLLDTNSPYSPPGMPLTLPSVRVLPETSGGEP